MRALEPLVGLRVVADPAALDSARWRSRDGGADRDGSRGRHVTPEPLVLRLAADEAFAIDVASVEIDDPHAIVEVEAGFSATRLSAADLTSVVGPHIEWELPHERPALAQGLVAGVPAKLALDEEGGLLVTATAYAAELESRLG